MARHDEDENEEREIQAMRDWAMRMVADVCERHGRDVLSEPPPVEEGGQSTEPTEAPEAPKPPPSPLETKRTGCGCPCAPGDAETCHSEAPSEAATEDVGAPWGATEEFDPMPRPRRPRRLAPRQVMAARMLLAGRRIYEVAAHLGVNRHTVATWLKWPEFQDEVHRMVDEAVARRERDRTP